MTESVSLTAAASSCLTMLGGEWTLTNSVLLALTAVTLLSYIWVARNWSSSFEGMRDVTCPLPLPPGSMGYPYIGESLEFIRKGSDFFSSRLGRYGRVYKTHLLGSPTVRLVGGEHVKPVLLGENSAVTSFWPWSVRRLVGSHSLLGMNREEHRATKNVISSVFTPTTMASFVPRIQAVMDGHIDSWCQQGDVLGFPATQLLTLDLSLEITLGVGADRPDKASLHAAMKQFVHCIFSLPIVLPGSGVWKGLRARERILQEVRQKLGSSEDREGVDFLSLVELMMRCPGLQSHSQVVEDNALELFFAGYSTVTSALCMALLCLGRNPKELAKLEAELEEAGLMEDPNSELTYDIIGKLEYVHNCNREVLRLFPPAGAGFRQVNKTMQIGDYQIPKDWKVAYSIRETQQTSDLFPEPDRFWPDRWLAMDSDDMRERARFQYIPFGQGARQCVGRRLAMLYQAVFLVQVVRRCRFALKNPTPLVKYIPVVKPVDDLPVTFSRRQV